MSVIITKKKIKITQNDRCGWPGLLKVQGTSFQNKRSEQNPHLSVKLKFIVCTGQHPTLSTAIKDKEYKKDAWDYSLLLQMVLTHKGMLYTKVPARPPTQISEGTPDSILYSRVPQRCKPSLSLFCMQM